jgi:hypothetical protein
MGNAQNTHSLRAAVPVAEDGRGAMVRSRERMESELFVHLTLKMERMQLLLFFFGKIELVILRRKGQCFDVPSCARNACLFMRTLHTVYQSSGW